MSYDLEIWSIREAVAGGAGSSSNPAATKSEQTYSGRGWQLNVDPSIRVDAEDIPQNVEAALPGIQFLTRLYLEGTMDSSSITKAKNTAKAIAREAHGVVADLQNETIETPSGVKRLSPMKQEERITVLMMSWFVQDHSPIRTPEGRDQFLSLIEKSIPELMPVRYGTYEPLQFRYKETGRQHFLDFLTQELGTTHTPFWEPKRPFRISLGMPEESGDAQGSYSTNRVTVEMDYALLGQPGWRDQIKRFWLDVSRFLQPFYADMRLLRWQTPSGAYPADESLAEEHPVRAGFWQGIPEQTGCAVVLGKEYQAKWPAFAEAATHDGPLAFLALDEWPCEGNITELVGKVPAEWRSPGSHLLRAAWDAYWENRRKELQEEQKGLLEELREAGVDVKSIDALVSKREPYPAAIPVLLRHLSRPYSPNIKDMIARALAVPEAEFAFEQILAEYRREAAVLGAEKFTKLHMDGFAVAVSLAIPRKRKHELLRLAKDESLGDSRLLFLSPLRRSNDPVIVQGLIELSRDPFFQKEIGSWKAFVKKHGLSLNES